MGSVRTDAEHGVRAAGATSDRLRQALLLLRPTARSMRWAAVVGAAAGALLVAWRSSQTLSVGGPPSLAPIRMAAVLLCLGASFMLDDEAGVTVEPAVASLAVRRGLRLALGLLAIGAAWAATLVVASGSAHRGVEAGSLPAAGLTLEAAALLAVTLAAGAVATRSLGHGNGGVAAGPMLLAFVAGAVAIRPYWSLFPGGRIDPEWVPAHLRWTAILGGATIVLVWTSLDPARRSAAARGRRWIRRTRRRR